MPATSLLPDDDDETLDRTAPSDVDTAITYLLTSFPYQPPSPTYIEPRTVLVSQLYGLVADRTAVDREVDRRRRANEVRVMRCAQLGVDEYAMITTAEYVAVVQSMWRLSVDRGDKVAAGEERKEEVSGAATIGTAVTSSSLFAPNSQPIRRKRPRTDISPSPARPPLSPSARQPAVSTLARPASAPASSTSSTRNVTAAHSMLAAAPVKSAVAADDDKENAVYGVVLTLPTPTTSQRAVTSTAAVRSSASARSADQQLLLHTLIHSFLPHYTDVSITRAELLSRLYDGLAYQQMTADDIISTLFHHQLVTHNTATTTSSSSASSTSYLLLLPHTAHLIRECIDARHAIVRLIEHSRYKQVRKSELEGRVRLACTERGIVWHMLEMIGCGRLIEVETTKGTVVRVNSDYKQRVRR